MSTRGILSPGSLSLHHCDHIRGSLDAPIVIVEYGDYQCPQSGQAYALVKSLQRQGGDKLCFVFRHCPQHPRSLRAAESAEAAAAQNRFWEMHELLLNHQDALDDGDLVQYASALGLEIPRFLQEMATHAHAEQVRRDIERSKAHRVDTAPTFFITLRHGGVQNLEPLLRSLIR